MIKKRKCCICGLEKRLKDFWKCDPYRCKSCEGKRNKKYFAENKDKKRKYNLTPLAKELGISADELYDIYNHLFEQQKGMCAICGIHQSEIKKSFAVDHNHKTGQIRGLLCGNCNLGLGNFRESIEIIDKTKSYLKKWNSNNN